MVSVFCEISNEKHLNMKVHINCEHFLIDQLYNIFELIQSKKIQKIQIKFQFLKLTSWVKVLKGSRKKNIS